MGLETRAEIVFDGEVQGVGFRYYARRVARRLGLFGFVENLGDGRVRVVCEGGRERIEELVELLRRAPPPMGVESAEIRYSGATGEFKSFSVVAGDLSQEMVEGFSTGAAYFEVMFQKQDQLLQKQDETLAEIKGLRLDLKTMLDERLAKMERDIAEVRARLGLQH